MTITHSTFTIERLVRATPARVFAAYSSLEAKRAWFKTPPDCETLERSLDFRIGGTERYRARWPSHVVTDFQATYRDLVENERIVLVYDLFHDGTKLSVSLQTLEMRADGDATRLLHTEQGCYLVGGAEAAAGREHGTTLQVDDLVALLEGRAPKAVS